MPQQKDQRREFTAEEIQEAEYLDLLQRGNSFYWNEFEEKKSMLDEALKTGAIPLKVYKKMMNYLKKEMGN